MGYHKPFAPFRFADWRNQVATGGAPAFVPDLVALDFNGTTEHMIETVRRDHGFGPNFSWMAWLKPDQIGGVPTGDLFQFIQQLARSEGTGGAERLDFFMDNSASGRMKVELKNAAGQLRKQYRWGGVFTIGSWLQVLITWDGTTLQGFFDGVFQAPSIQVDLSHTVVREDRITGTGRIDPTSGFRWDGRMHSIALWDADISAAAATIFNGGAGRSFDLQKNQGAYTFAGNLLPWWRFGFDPSSIGRDFGSGPILIDANASGTGNMSASDIVTDAP